MADALRRQWKWVHRAGHCSGDDDGGDDDDDARGTAAASLQTGPCPREALATAALHPPGSLRSLGSPRPPAYIQPPPPSPLGEMSKTVGA